MKRKPAAKSVRFRHEPPHVVLFGGVSTAFQIGPDKGSLDDQFATLEEKAREFNWIVRDRIIVPGFSRNFFTYREFCEAAAEAGIFDPQRLWQHWTSGDIDVIACINVSRLGREQSIVDEFVGRTYNAGMFLYTLKNGLVMPEQRRTTFMIEGYAAATETEEFTRRYKVGMKARLERGLPPNKPPRSHRYIYENNRPVRLVVNEAERPFLNAARDVLFTGVSWNYFSIAMAARGYLNPASGRPYGPGYFRNFFYDALVWGNQVVRESATAGKWERYGAWCFTPAVSPPPGITVTFGTHEAAYSGSEAEDIQHYILNFKQANTGKRRSGHRLCFSGLLVCAECGHHFTSHTQPRKQPGRIIARYWGCLSTNGSYRQAIGACHNRKLIREQDVCAWFDGFIQRLFSVPSVDAAFAAFAPPPDDSTVQIAAAETELAAARARARMYVIEQGKHPELASEYTEQLNAAAALIRGLEARLTTLRQQSARQAAPERGRALAAIRDRYAEFWQQDETEINTLLTRLMGEYRLAVRDGEIVAIVVGTGK